MPQEYAAFLTRLYELVPGLRDVVLSVHCHDDLGPGRRQLLRRPAGGRAPGRVRDQRHRRARRQRVAGGDRDAPAHARGRRRLHDRHQHARDRPRQPRWSRRLTGYGVQPNKAVVGRNAFQHESGIHQDGVLKERSTYEIMSAASVGFDDVELDRARQALRPPRAAVGADGPGLRGRRPDAQPGLQALQGARGQEEAGHRDGPRGARHRRAPRRRPAPTRSSGSTSRPPRGARRTRRSRSSRPTGETRARRLHRRRPDRRDLPRDQLRHPARGAPARVPHRRRHRRPGRARRGVA